MTLNKADLIDSIYNRVNLSKNKSVQVVESLLEIIKETLANGEDVLVAGFGKFVVKEKRERREGTLKLVMVSCWARGRW